ncbi:4-hydroxy-tetrahydrodipicolinate reductase [Cloacibacillus porcorum]|uniref:4-hydroxy-tetrahydrodipicolinate reductase n=1 Tax=Cloacibacillus porcorum TaxID=1197717 RepID=UPI0023F19187|nr:dihydrodipicolinate reductase C-terminal domain-containing protein [Cloacibacillus porcorum]MDD7650642.1 dihydrodipicolinate reductase C-terminal domain-containing protein [Cloacibacillus porcorum]MDY4092579.1 dihydrodipicolinate reductase C-terminal domain-containing protein [Cloacibacillus porcorum]
MIRVFVTGISGNVGRAIVKTIEAKEGFELVGGWAKETGLDIGVAAGTKELGMTILPSLAEALKASRPDVAIDFSATPVLENNMRAYLDAGLNAVIGTTGLTEEQLAPYRDKVAERGLRWAVIPNYGLGISLAADFIKHARKYYPYVTITDQHTNEMMNAPSGTAAALAAAAASEGALGAVASRESYAGVLGAAIEGVPVFSQRLPWPGPFSGHEITLARKDEVIKISVQDFTSDIYMDGIFLTAEKIAAFPAGSFLRSLSAVLED